MNKSLLCGFIAMMALLGSSGAAFAVTDGVASPISSIDFGGASSIWALPELNSEAMVGEDSRVAGGSSDSSFRADQKGAGLGFASLVEPLYLSLLGAGLLLLGTVRFGRDS